MALAREYKDLRVYSAAFEAAMALFQLSNGWPKDERYSLTDQARRSSRSVCANIAEAWRRRLYVASFVSKLSDANAEAGETQVWLDFALACGYLDEATHHKLYHSYGQVSGGLIKMIANPEGWCGPAALREESAYYSTDLDDPPE
jgi:four helix bundle protein